MKFGTVVVCSKCKQPIVSGQGFGYVCFKIPGKEANRLNLMRAIRKLPAGNKKLFFKHDVIGYQHSEIAGLVGCSTGCSKSQVHKARKRLRRLLLGEASQGDSMASA